MLKEVKATIVFAALLGIQIVSSHKCYHCKDPESCAARPLAVTDCNAEHTQQTTAYMREIMQDVPDVTSGNTVCWTYAFNGTGYTAMAYRGCVYKAIDPCELGLKPPRPSSNPNWSFTRSCSTCTADLCNAAGAFSYSGYTLLTSLVGLFLVKIFTN